MRRAGRAIWAITAALLVALADACTGVVAWRRRGRAYRLPEPLVRRGRQVLQVDGGRTRLGIILAESSRDATHGRDAW